MWFWLLFLDYLDLVLLLLHATRAVPLSVGISPLIPGGIINSRSVNWVNRRYLNLRRLLLYLNHFFLFGLLLNGFLLLLSLLLLSNHLLLALRLYLHDKCLPISPSLLSLPPLPVDKLLLLLLNSIHKTPPLLDLPLLNISDCLIEPQLTARRPIPQLLLQILNLLRDFQFLR